MNTSLHSNIDRGNNMNASRARADGRKQFCPEDTPEDYFKRVGRNPSWYYLECFKQGWCEEAAEYEKSHSDSQETEIDTFTKMQQTLFIMREFARTFAEESFVVFHDGGATDFNMMMEQADELLEDYHAN